MENLFVDTGQMFQIAVVVMLLVLAAMIIDLGAGLYKAKQRGELRTSEALRRTLTKFISYEGGLMIATMADLFIHFCKFYSLIGVNMLVGVPVVSLLVGLFLLIVEFMSVREKADQKTKKQQEKVAELLAGLINKEDVLELIRLANERKAQKEGAIEE
ncbi:MAG: phage holin family protein [Bacteroidales bacterium]|nr:phage holin family protein [Bacteroidales bacterium]MBR0084213.1 phage holin family protein [Bacteroidales bacterium]MBR0290981.1 phage holin family protein [Bacteroidales bacterium]